jgi:hypothetical protein
VSDVCPTAALAFFVAVKNWKAMFLYYRGQYVGRPSDKRWRTDLGGRPMQEDMEKVTIRLPKRYLRRLDFLVRVDDFPSRCWRSRSACSSWTSRRPSSRR